MYMFLVSMIYLTKRRQILDKLSSITSNGEYDPELIIIQISLVMGVSKKIVQEIFDDAKKVGIIK